MTTKVEALKNELVTSRENDLEVWEVPHRADSRYLSHNYFRYIGKFPPQLPREFIRRYAVPGRPILDPMCGGGTVLIEAKIAGCPSIGYDVNPVSTLVSRVVTTAIEPALLEKYLRQVIDAADEALPSGLFALQNPGGGKVPIPDLLGHEHYFGEVNLYALAWLKSFIDKIESEAVRDFFLVAFLSIMRQVSRANVKKMNTEIDETKSPREVWPTFHRKLNEMIAVNRELCSLPDVKVTVVQNDARKLPLPDQSLHLTIVHPPYLTNTAFSEAVEIPLAWLGVKHTQVWRKELRARGSFLNEPDGLRKYLISWHTIMSEIYRVTEPQGVCVVVVGDGQMDYVRIPVGTITAEFADDLGFRLEERIRHRINNNTGMTQNRKMRDQHILVLRKI